ncbi:hypothetical protein BO83DRAFT_456608 [Aspergillus eucalypticola CBS 122712]|uniref:Uncharacterized protein n=1 Tax=Aspergillus eucalypticola (strain CBS 122712 / IBT 29274) TaxID=1448314 RepID=A0A317UQI5_ASPEC|nr:uncharacterized protein BO83DRAFT_456608 [Aspergillus eucalypticola CBS 122712]PWY63516.1 hypothetical protein BO83DRAFT_456608 [Aspergillus eucalypticola CBS 122712]
MQNQEEHEGIYVLCRREFTDVVDDLAKGIDSQTRDLQLLPPPSLPSRDFMRTYWSRTPYNWKKH